MNQVSNIILEVEYARWFFVETIWAHKKLYERLGKAMSFFEPKVGNQIASSKIANDQIKRKLYGFEYRLFLLACALSKMAFDTLLLQKLMEVDRNIICLRRFSKHGFPFQSRIRECGIGNLDNRAVWLRFEYANVVVEDVVVWHYYVSFSFESDCSGE